MKHRRHIRLIIVPAQAVVLPGHTAAATKTRESIVNAFFLFRAAFPLCRRIHRKVIDDPKNRSSLLCYPPCITPFPLSARERESERDRFAESGTVPVMHAPITICLHEILGFFFHHGRQEKISPRGFTYSMGDSIRTSARARARARERGRND